MVQIQKPSFGARPPQAWVKQITPVLPPPFALVEMAALVALVLLEYYFDGFPALTRINPHPYWIAILLLSLQYGTVSGLIAASIAIVGTVLIGMPEPDIEERYFNYLIRAWTQPVLWLLVALLLGTFRARQIEQRTELLRQAENLRVRGATLLDYSNNLRARCTMLERRIATRQTGDASQALAALARLSEAAPGRWAAVLGTALDAAFPGGQLSLYTVDGGRARLILTHGSESGMTAPAAAPAELAANHPLLARVAGASRSASILDPEDDAALSGLGVAAVPVFGTVAGSPRVIGLLIADRLPPGQIDQATTRRLAVIAAHLAPALQLGLVSPVAEAADAPEPGRGSRGTSVGDAIPTVRKWRLLKGLVGGRTQSDRPPDRTDG